MRRPEKIKYIIYVKIYNITYNLTKKYDLKTERVHNFIETLVLS